jgi:hypothetical protein
MEFDNRVLAEYLYINKRMLEKEKHTHTKKLTIYALRPT